MSIQFFLHKAKIDDTEEGIICWWLLVFNLGDLCAVLGLGTKGSAIGPNDLYISSFKLWLTLLHNEDGCSGFLCV